MRANELARTYLRDSRTMQLAEHPQAAVAIAVKEDVPATGLQPMYRLAPERIVLLDEVNFQGGEARRELRLS